MTSLDPLLKNNRAWSEKIRREDPTFFDRLKHIQSPDYLWIGCSDSRVPANQITGLVPGEVFVHRNVANQVVHTDINCLSVIQFAVEKLKVSHIIVCGHYGCGGVQAVLDNEATGLLGHWLRGLHDAREWYAKRLAKFHGKDLSDRLAELNVVEQAFNVCHSTVVQNAWKRKQKLSVHGWIYRLSDGLLHDLGFTTQKAASVGRQHKRALEKIFSARAR